MSTDVSEEYFISIFMVEISIKKEGFACHLLPCLAYFFDPEDRGEVFLRIIG
jgi:hypothetical protein